jgi:UDP-N-acetylmuramyl pentapeptide phosphotransferase/UDP-N-acetylglucosamine-1-phosphate transferase
MLNYVLWAAGVGLIASVGLVATARYWAQRQMLLDHPNDRSLHAHPTPRSGGVGIVVPICVAIGGVGALVPETRSAATWLACVGLLIAAVGVVDDIRGLPALTRLVAHVFAAALVVAGIGTWRTFAWPGLWCVDLEWAAVPFTVLLIAGLINAYNFMDGVDGIAGSQGVVAGFGWIGAGYAVQDPLVVVAGAVIAMTNLGFLVFNWPPASVFMGDVGSTFLGFLLAALPVFVATRSPAMATAGMLFVWPFVFDTTFSLLRRAGRRENLLRAHRSHLYQRLVLTGVSHRTVALLYGALAAVGVVVGYVVAREARFASMTGALVIGGLAAGLWAVVVWREREQPRPPLNQRHQAENVSDPEPI